MKTYHCPGPWSLITDLEATFDNDGRTEPLIEIGNREEGQTSCYATNITNARFIAAAPDMLQALKGLIDYFGDDVDNGLDELLTEAKAAIFKATRN